MSELRERCDRDVGVASKREGVEGEEDTEPGLHGRECGPEAFKALDLGDGVGEGRGWGGGEAMGVNCKGCGVDVELENC